MIISRTATVLTFIALMACSKDKAPAAGTTGDSGAVAALPADAAPPVTGEPTANDISNYKLDMDKMRKFAAAMKGFKSLGKQDSMALEAAGSENNESTAQTIARLERSPVAVRVLREAGLTPRDYVWITAAWLQAAMTQGVLESSKDAKLPAGQNPQNIEFLKAHKAEMDALGRDLGMSGGND
jgi:hypothetical protein